MARARLFDEEDVDLYITNRGGANHTTFEVRADFRCFEACLALSVRRDEIKVHSFVLMMNDLHHLLLRSHRYVLEAMRRI